MKYAFISLDFRRFPLEFCFQAAERYGFDGLEIWAGRPHAFPADIDTEAAKKILKWTRQYGIEVPMFTPHMLGGNYRLTSTNSRERKEAIELFCRHIDVANAIECPSLLVVADHPGYGLDYETVWEGFVDSIQKLAQYGEARGVKIVIEPLTPMESPIITTADHCVRLIRDAGSSNLYAMLDLVPPTVAHEPLSDYFTKLGDRMIYIHVCNTDGTTDAHMRLENGVIPIIDMFSVIKHYGYDGWVCAELYSENYRDPELFAANTIRILRNVTEI
jgi:protein FrlC